MISNKLASTPKINKPTKEMNPAFNSNNNTEQKPSHFKTINHNTSRDNSRA